MISLRVFGRLLLFFVLGFLGVFTLNFLMGGSFILSSALMGGAAGVAAYPYWSLGRRVVNAISRWIQKQAVAPTAGKRPDAGI